VPVENDSTGLPGGSERGPRPLLLAGAIGIASPSSRHLLGNLIYYGSSVYEAVEEPLPDRNSITQQEPPTKAVDLSAASPMGSIDVHSMGQFLEKANLDFVGVTGYLHVVNNMLSEKMLEATNLSILAFYEEISTRELLERMPYTQSLLAHARVAWLTKLLTKQTDAHALGIVSEACERAAGTFGRLTRAISEYRKPAGPATQVSISQGNQVLVQNLVKVENHDEQTEIGAIAKIEALPFNAQGAALPFAGSTQDETLEMEQRTQNTTRKSNGRTKRISTRREIGHGRGRS